MIYFLLIIILGFYFYFLLNDAGEEDSKKVNNSKKIFLIILFITPLFFIYISMSGIQDMNEYQRILKKNESIRENIIKIKASIPKLEGRLQEEPNFHEGWVMLARSYSIVGKPTLSIIAYETALSLKSNDTLVLKEYLNLLRADDGRRNKEKIINTYNKLLNLDKKDTSILLNKLHYSVKINDSELMINTLNEIIDHPQILDKDRYRKILTKIRNN